METSTAEPRDEKSRPVIHAEVVGSMLRPAELVPARARMRAGDLDPASYHAIEDQAVDQALRIQEDAGAGCRDRR